MRASLVALFALSSALAAPAEEFYVLQGIDKTHPNDVLTSPGVDGFTIRVSWQKLHDEGFAWLDGQIARGAQLDVDMQLRVMAGTHAPASLPGVAYYQYLWPGDLGVETHTAPVPWDAAMQLHWQALAGEMAARYGDNPRIKVVHVPSFANSSELHMPLEVTQLAGYSSRTLAESWAAMARPLSAAFPEAIVSLNYATPTQSRITGEDSDWLLEEIAAMAGDRAGYQANDLDAEVTLDRNKYVTLLEQEELGRHIGFQMVSSSNTLRFGGEFEEAVDTAREAGASWLEIYANDIENIPPSGDFNDDGRIDGADLALWRSGFGASGAAEAMDGDADRDLDVDGADFLAWQRQFGSAAGMAALASSSSAVPEPNCQLALLGATFAASLYVRSRRLRVAG